ncbi:MAG: hypothetical protein AAFX05_04685 [Planctomycetota bacterium]
MRTAHLLRPLVVVLLLLHGSVVSAADIETRTIRYEVDGQPYVGYLAAPADAEDAPGILVVHEWWGLNDYAKLSACAPGTVSEVRPSPYMSHAKAT